MIVTRMEFKLALIRKFGSQTAASVETGVRQTKLSFLQRGICAPNERDIEKLSAHFTPRELRKFFGRKLIAAKIQESAR